MKVWMICAVLLLTTASLRAADDMKAFVPPDEGMTRHVLQLPAKDDESLFKIELIVGKTVLIDDQNHYFFAGQIDKEQIVGWGFTQYKVKDLGPMAGTLMAVDPNAPKVSRFISLGGEPSFIRYNSRLPIVVYVPKGVEVRYRIWSTAVNSMEIEEG